MNRGIELGHNISIIIFVELHDPENVQLSAHLKSFTKVFRILLHMVSVDGVHIDKEVLLGFENIKEDGKLEPVSERTVDQSGILVFLIRFATAPCPKLLGRHFWHGFAWLWLDPRLLLQLRRRWRITGGVEGWRDSLAGGGVALRCDAC